MKGLSPEIFIIPEADVVLLTEGSTLIADSLIGTWQGDASPAGSETVARYQMDIMGTRETVQRSYLLVLWVQVPPLQFSVGNVVISDSGWSDPMAESSEVKAFYREASNQKGRSESERNRRRNEYRCSCQVSWVSRRWLLSLLEETEGCTQGSYRRVEGGNSGENSRESTEGLRTSQDDPGMTKTVPITEEGNGKEVCRLADEVDKRRSQEDDKLGGARTSGFRRDGGDTSSGHSAGIWMLTKPKSQSVGQTGTFETDSHGSDEVCSRCTGKGSLRAERPPEFEAVLWENPMYGILEGALETGLWQI